MTSFQSTLGEEEGVAEQLAAGQREISIAEFFEKNKHMLGFDSSARGLVTAVKEAVDNALDATEEAGILPDVYVDVREVGDYYRLVVEDNGPGITREQLPKVFGKLLYGSRFHAREQSLTPDQRLLVRRDGAVESVPIGVLCDAYLPQEGAATAPVAGDIEVPSFDRGTHEMTWQPITHVIRHETDEPTYEITTEKGRTVEVTGNHSVFGLTADGETTEVAAGEVEPGDTLLTPRQLPSLEETISTVNLLEYISLEQLEGRRLYVYGFDAETLRELQSGEMIRTKPSPDSERERTCYRYDGVDILKDSLETNYLEDGYLPAETVVELGWEDRAADCELRTYQVGGDPTTMPVSVPVSESFVRMLGYYVAEGHTDDRQVGFTFGAHEGGLVGTTEQAVASLGCSTTTVERERNMTRVKAFGSPLSMFLERTCGETAHEKRVPEFVFRLAQEYQREFIAAVYRSDGSDTHPSDELSHSTKSETLARQLSVLWNMQGVLASTETIEDSHGYGSGTTPIYRTKVYGEDADLSDALDVTESGEQGYKRVPTSLLSEHAVGSVPHETVPDSIPGLLMGVGVGSSIEHSAVYQSLIEDALAGEYVEEPRYVHDLREMGLLDDDHRPTDRLESLWETVRNLQGLTDSDMCLLPVESVRETDPPEYVYDVSVPGATGHDENFVVANEGALSVKNSRGQQGIGISAAVLYSQLTSGQPAKITSRPKGSAEGRYFELIIDTDTNEPDVKTEETTSWDRPHGTRIELEMEANMRARSQLHAYIQHTAVVNPHARIELREPGLEEPLKFERATDQLPDETEEIRPHPHGVELGTLLKMLEATSSYSLSGFLQEEFTRVGEKTAEKVLSAFRDRYYGRGLSWRPPADHEDPGVAAVVTEATANKSSEATAAFAASVAEAVAARERVSYDDVATVVDEAADDVAADHDETFGETVRENVLEALWDVLTSTEEPDRLTPQLYGLVDEATSTRKDDATVQRLAEGLAIRLSSLDNGRQRVTRDRLEVLVDEAADRTVEQLDVSVGDTARENVLEALWGDTSPVTDDLPRVYDVADERDVAADLLEAMRATDILAPPTNCLSPITADLVEAGLRKEFDADFYAAATRDAEVHGGDPFIIEAGIAYGGDIESEGSVDLLRFANRVPLVYQRGACAITDVVKSIGWRNYGLDQPGGSGLPNGPAVLMVHVASTNVPFTSESKDAVANVPAIEDEVELAIREAARELKSYLNRRRSLQKRREKQDALGRILPRMADKVAEVTGRDRPDIGPALARIMNNVSVERTVEDGTVRLAVENYSDRAETVEVTDIVSVEPGGVNGDVSVVEMDGEWFLRWSPSVPSGETASLSYTVPDDAEFDIEVEGVETEKLTVNA
jgi:DNA topoisomerase-6 subunit B